MPSSIANVETKLQQFISLVDGDKLKEAEQALVELKTALFQFPSLGPLGDSPTAAQEQVVARTIFEYASILSVKSQDMAAFERHISQLRVIYSDFNKDIPSSKLRHPLLGMRLLHLLIENRMAEFHSDLEGLSDEDRRQECIAFAVKLEQQLMEGSYHQVLETRSKVPFPLYKFFMAGLLNTVREAIADCSEVSYHTMTLKAAQQLMFFESQAELLSYLKTERPEWTVAKDIISFKTSSNTLSAQDIPSMRLISETLAYATELDRIV